MNEVSRAARARGSDYSLLDLQCRPYAVLRRQGLYGIAKRIRRIRTAYDDFAIHVRPNFPLMKFWVFYRVGPNLISRSTTRSALWLELAAIHGLAEEGLLERIRECETCGEWFYAYRPSPVYRFHADACREKYWRSSDEGKKKRRIFMRKYRAGLKRKERAERDWRERRKIKSAK